MRKLINLPDAKIIKNSKQALVPTIFTEHQYNLLLKKASGKKLSKIEQIQFSRTVSKKLKAITAFYDFCYNGIYVYGISNILPERLKLAIKYVKQLSRKFKNSHIFISGSFLYNKKYNDLDVFVVIRYEKKDYRYKQFSINYLHESFYNTLFYESIRKLAVSNRKMESSLLKKKPDIKDILHLYEETYADYYKNKDVLKESLRKFIVHSSFLLNQNIPDSYNLNKQVDRFINNRLTPLLIKQKVKEALFAQKNVKKELKKIIDWHLDTLKEYPKQKKFTMDLISPYKEVIKVVS